MTKQTQFEIRAKELLKAGIEKLGGQAQYDFLLNVIKEAREEGKKLGDFVNSKKEIEEAKLEGIKIGEQEAKDKIIRLNKERNEVKRELRQFKVGKKAIEKEAEQKAQDVLKAIDKVIENCSFIVFREQWDNADVNVVKVEKLEQIKKEFGLT